MASTAVATIALTAIEVRVLRTLLLGSPLNELIGEGYSHWQVTTAIESTLNSGLAIRKNRDLILSEAGIAAIEAKLSTEKRRGIEPLDEFRLARKPGEAKVRIGRQTLEHIRNRVSS